MADGVLGLSPVNYGRHSFLVELKIAGLIEKTQVSFSNAFYKHSRLSNKSRDHFSYIIFGGYNSSQIVGGEQGLVSLPMAPQKINPTMFWAVSA